MLDTGEWIKDVIWDARRVSPGLLQSDEEMEDSTVLTASTVVAPSGPASKLDPYNVSNDHLYERSRESRYRIRQTFGAIEVFHSTPAKALQMPFVSIPFRRFMTKGIALTLGLVQNGLIQSRSEGMATSGTAVSYRHYTVIFQTQVQPFCFCAVKEEGAHGGSR